MKTPQQVLQEARVEKSLIGKNVHSVYTHCLSCHTWSVNMPLDKVCGSCNKDTDTYTYYDIETILSWHTSTLQAFIEAEIARLEGDNNYKHCCESGEGTECEYQRALRDQISHFKELLEILKK